MGWRLAIGISVMWVPLAFLGDGLTTIVLPSVLSTASPGATSLGLISFAGLGLAVVVQPIAGRLSDRLRGRLGRQAFMAVWLGPALGALLVLGITDAVVVAVVAYLAIMSTASSIQAAQQTLIPEHAAATRRGRAASLKTAFDIGGAFLAFLLLGWLMETVGVGGAVVTIGVVLLAAMLVVRIWVPSESTEGRSTEADPGPGPIAWPAGFWQLVVARFLFLFGVYVTGRFLLLLLAERLGIPASSAAGETGLLLAAFTLTTALTALLLGPIVDRVGRTRLAVVGALIAAVGVAIFVPPLGLPGALLAGTVMSVGTAVFVTANWAALTDISPPKEAGRLLAFANLGTGGAAACAGLVGPMIDAWGFTPVLVLAIAVILTAVVAVQRPLPGTHLEAMT